jgi:hypothetical protein
MHNPTFTVTIKSSLQNLRSLRMMLAGMYHEAVKTRWSITILAFAALNACKHEASVERSSIWIDVAGQGDPNIQAGLSKEMIYVMSRDRQCASQGQNVPYLLLRLMSGVRY